MEDEIRRRFGVATAIVAALAVCVGLLTASIAARVLTATLGLSGLALRWRALR